MNILISFCNTIDTPGYPNLGVIDIDTKEFRVLELPTEIPQTGMLGIAVTSLYVFIGLQHSVAGEAGYESPPSLLVFDRKNFNLIHTYIFELARDAHSFLLLDDSTLLVVSSGTDEIIEIKLKGYEVISEDVYWKFQENGERADLHHLNSICKLEGDIYISGFGEKEPGGDWGTAHNGFIYNITKGEEIINGLEQPHSLCVIDDEIAFCESRSKKLRFVDRKEFVELPGYARGLCHHSKKIFTGTSASRKKSKSTGKAVVQHDDLVSGCTISQVSIDKLEVEYTWDLNDYGIEIYELVMIDDVSSWPLRVPENYRLQFMNSWMYRVQQALGEIKQVIPAGETLLLVDENLLQVNNRILPEHTWWPFIERDGKYWGPPENSEAALEQLERMIEKGAQYIVFAWPAYWWLDQYVSFQKYLSQYHKRISESEDVIIYSLTGKN